MKSKNRSYTFLTITYLRKFDKKINFHATQFEKLLPQYLEGSSDDDEVTRSTQKLFIRRGADR